MVKQKPKFDNTKSDSYINIHKKVFSFLIYSVHLMPSRLINVYSIMTKIQSFISDSSHLINAVLPLPVDFLSIGLPLSTFILKV